MVTAYDEGGSLMVFGKALTNSEGITANSWPYSDVDVYVFYACVVAGQQLVSNPLMLTMDKRTTLYMNVGNPDLSCSYPISGKFLYNGQPISNKPIFIKVNGTAVSAFNITSDGSYSFLVTLPPVDNMPTEYQVELVYHGSDSLNLNGLDTSVNGTEYVVCTTLQYFPYKPASNITWLTVQPQSTQVVQQTKTPEQLQQEAEQSGWLTIWHEFSWWYPWYRLHYRLSVNLPQGNPNIDYGWSLLPFGESSNADNTALANIMNDATEGSDPTALIELFVGVAVPLIIQAGTSRLLGRSLVAILVATALYAAFVLSEAATLYFTTGKNPKIWLMAFVGIAFVEMAELFIIGGEGVVNLLHLLTAEGRLVLQKIQQPLQALRALKLSFFDITSAIFTLIDFAVMVFYLAMYFNSI